MDGMDQYEITIGLTAPVAPDNTLLKTPLPQRGQPKRRILTLHVVPKPEIDVAGIWVVYCDTPNKAWTRARKILKEQQERCPEKPIEIISVMLRPAPAAVKGNGYRSSSRLP